VAIACLWALMRLVLGGTWRIEPPTPHPAAFAAAACAGVMLWISLVRTGRSGAGAATIPVLMAGGAGVLGPGLATLAIPILAVLTVITLTFAAHWAAVRVTLVGLAATVATLGAFSTAVGGAAPPLWSSSAAFVQVDAARAYHGEATQTVGTSDRPDRPPSRRAVW
jgi:hypothetical protein